jgi:hypothetical protein
MEIQLYKQKYKGTKVTFNSRKGAGKTIEGIAVDTDEKLNIAILRDADNFPHCVSILTLEEI